MAAGDQSEAPERWLRLRFTSASEFERAYRRDIARGGAFVPCEPRYELREAVQVLLELVWCGESVQLDAEVVHVVPRELAAAGGTAGVAVQFGVAAPDLRALLARFAGLAEGGAERKPELADPMGVPLSLDDDEAFAFGPGAEAGGGVASPEAYDPTLREIEPAPASKPEGVPRARRNITRVHVRMATPDGVLEGRTGDISHSGVRVFVDGNDVPVRTPVRLTLRDPSSGAVLEVEGRVARHVRGEGTVAGLGIHFEVPPARRAEVERFVDRLWMTDHARRLGGIRGDVGEVGLANLLQVLSQSAPGGTLSVRCAGEEGVVAFENGRLRYARLGRLSGVKALVRMLCFEEASFEFHAHVDPLEHEEVPGPLEASVLEALRQVDEAAQHHGEGYDPEARLQIDRSRAAQVADLSQTQLAVVDLAGAGLTLRRALDVIPEPDGRILQAIESLRERGILTLE